MIVSHIGNRALSLYITEAELQAHRLTPEQVDRTAALAFLQAALQEKRLDDWDAAELALFPGRSGLLLFARRKSGLPHHFFFSDFETLLCAVICVSDVLPSALSRVPAGYLLTVYPFEGELPPAVFYEFGDDLGSCAYLEAHLAEQEHVLLPDTAIARLRMHFAS